MNDLRQRDAANQRRYEELMRLNKIYEQENRKEFENWIQRAKDMKESKESES